MQTPRERTIKRFRDVLAQPNAFLVGAAVGSGVTAQAAERGGADMLITLNAGRFRMMGVSSLAAMLPLRDSNALVDTFGSAEIVNRTNLPVIYGANWRKDRVEAETLVSRIREQGYAGISNFPTIIHYSEEFQQILEKAGFGFDRELELVKLGQKHGLCGIAYVSSSKQARLAAQAGADVVCMNFGWNSGGASGITPSMSLMDVAARTHEFVKIARSWNPQTICLLEGGPIEKAEDMIDISRTAKVDGYIGGSTIELFPMGYSVAETTAGFKMTRMLHDRIQNLEKRLATFKLKSDLLGTSPLMMEVIAQVSELGADSHSVLVSGPEGSGRSRVAASVCEHRSATLNVATFVFDASTLEQRAMIDLFGVASNRDHVRKVKRGLIEKHADDALIIENIEMAPKRIQDRLIELAESGHFKRVYGRKRRHSGVKLVLTSNTVSDGHSPGTHKTSIRPGLYQVLKSREIILPALKDRIADVPALVAHFSEINSTTGGMAPLELTPSASRELISYDWPGNLVELEQVTKNLQADNAFGKVDSDMVDRALNQSQAGSNINTKENGERVWILQALRRNGFRRSQAAAELGISRKTLYNKIKRYDILG